MREVFLGIAGPIDVWDTADQSYAAASQPRL